MKFARVNVYKATFDLIVEDLGGEQVQVESTPCEERLLIASNFSDAHEMAQKMRNELRWGAVHKKTAIRDITLQHVDVMIQGGPWEE